MFFRFNLASSSSFLALLAAMAAVTNNHVATGQTIPLDPADYDSFVSYALAAAQKYAEDPKAWESSWKDYSKEVSDQWSAWATEQGEAWDEYGDEVSEFWSGGGAYEALTNGIDESTEAEPVAAEPVAAEPVAAEPVPADEPVAAEPVAVEPATSSSPQAHYAYGAAIIAVGSLSALLI